MVAPSPNCVISEEAKYLLDWFAARNPEKSLEGEVLTIDFFDARLVDSLAILELVCAVEEKFDIIFHERVFQDRRFSTIGGLAEIITELKKKEG
ncbi:MAG TPA: phosphopantetheine-binding protein [Oculatellaceae cyanobacterium]